MSRKRKTKAKPTRINPASSHVHRRVKAMAAAGLVEDQIALRIGGDKNQLRRRYIDSIKQGRAAAQEERAAAELTKEEKKEQKLRETIARSFKSHWYDPQNTSSWAVRTASTKPSNGEGARTAG
jgi:uncharacterized protein YnzC (UPF0291/DUF896 family)